MDVLLMKLLSTNLSPCKTIWTGKQGPSLSLQMKTSSQLYQILFWC